MLSITFKNVGQGDGIIVKYGEKGEKCGIIDANKFESSNPVLDHIKSEGFSEIEFIFISHPHNDHYSGILEILNYCETKRVQIKVVGYTTDFNKKIIKALNESRDKLQLLSKIYKKMKELNDSKLIKHRTVLNDFSGSIPLSDGYQYRILSPSQTEKDQYNLSLVNKEFKFKDRDAANVISLVSLIESDDEYIILTSDSEINTLKRIGKSVLRRYKKKLLLGQIPHHGSIDNHYREFWKKRVYENNTPVAISVGPNYYGHPSQIVINELQGLQYLPELTIGKAYKASRSSLDHFSINLSSNNSGRDLIYNIA